MKLFKCEGGYAVGNPLDAHPELCRVKLPPDQTAWLYESSDDGATWEKVGAYQRNTRFGGYINVPTWFNEVGELTAEFLNQHVEVTD